MGAGASSLQRARKVLVIRAYNARKKNETLSEQFQSMTKTDKDGQRIIRLADVKAALGLSKAAWFDDVVMRVTHTEVGTVNADSFLRFLNTGELPEVTAAAEPKTPPARAALATVTSRSNSLSTVKEECIKPPPGPPLMGFSVLQPSGVSTNVVSTNVVSTARRVVQDAVAADSAALYPDVLTCLGFKAPTECRELWLHPGSTLAPKNLHKKAGPTRPLWRKRETVLHERIVQYTTVDADGTVQELIETEKSQNEVVHLECKETGEFAHRESQTYEQTETFNSEIVAAERGTEEYLHLKSKEDEYEHLESNMPKTKAQQRAEEEAAAAAMAEAEEQAAAAATAGEEQQWLDEQREGCEPAEDGGFGGGWWSAQQGEGLPPGPETEVEQTEESPQLNTEAPSPQPEGT